MIIRFVFGGLFRYQIYKFAARLLYKILQHFLSIIISFLLFQLIKDVIGYLKTSAGLYSLWINKKHLTMYPMFSYFMYYVNSI